MDLISIDEYKAYAKIKSNEQDDKLNLLIPMVSELVKNYCNRRFVDWAEKEKTEYYSDGGLVVYTAEQPIITVTSIQSKALPTETAYTELVEGVDYVIDYAKDNIFCLWGGNGFYSGPNALKIKYTGGYTLVPEDLKLGVMDLVSFYVKNESVQRKTLNSNQIAVEFKVTSDMPSHIKRVFDLYRIM